MPASFAAPVHVGSWHIALFRGSAATLHTVTCDSRGVQVTCRFWQRHDLEHYLGRRRTAVFAGGIFW